MNNTKLTDLPPDILEAVFNLAPEIERSMSLASTAFNKAVENVADLKFQGESGVQLYLQSF